VPGQRLGDLLEGVHPALGDGEAHDVPGDAALGHLEQQVGVPVLQRLVPREGQEPGGLGGRGPEQVPHNTLRESIDRGPCALLAPWRHDVMPDPPV
jgi:hypothetical protein